MIVLPGQPTRMGLPAERGALGDVDLLVSTSHHAAEVQRLAERLGKPRVTLCSARTSLRRLGARLENVSLLAFIVSANIAAIGRQGASRTEAGSGT